ncbi:MAG: ERF family protein, partial [Lactobacillus sp.]|nr:ERF family protein [Lactobacillus sp.]
MAVHEKLLKIQSSISVPKSQHNKFGNYDYRSCEDILSALKPLLAQEKCTLTVNDELLMVGNRYYI